MTAKRYRILLTMLILLSVCAVFLLPILGRTLHYPILPPSLQMIVESGQEDVSDDSPIYRMRLHRTLLAVLAGGGLALGGLVFQSLFRNPLATPYTLGIASGASLGAALCLRSTYWLGVSAMESLLGIPWVSFGAFAGAMLAMSVVYALGRYKDTSSEQMLLAGVAVNFFFSSMIVLLQYVSAPHDAMQMLRWTMGGVQNAVLADCLRLGPIVFVVCGVLLFLARELNVIVTGRERAQSLGVNVVQLRMILFITISIMIGAIVAVTGPIGFVGLMVPHIARLVVGPNHARLVPVSFFGGAVFLACCDTVSRIAFYPAELPVGIVTSLLGGPFFLWLLLRSERRLG